MNAIPQSANLPTDPPLQESENGCGTADVLLLVFSAVAAILIQVAAFSFS